MLMEQVNHAFPIVRATETTIRDNLELTNIFEIKRQADADLAIHWLIKEHNDVQDVNHESGTQDVHTVQAWPPTDDLTTKQLELVKLVEPLLVLDRQDPSFHQTSCLLVHGGPGTGKSYFVKHVEKSVSAAGCKLQCGAFAACAARLLPFSNTIHSVFSIPFGFQTAVYKPLKEQ